MNEWLQIFLQGDASLGPSGMEMMLLVVLLSFCIGHVIACVYMWTHIGLSYSRGFVASLVVLPILVALVMVLMSGSIVIAFGLLAVFAVVRFRNILKDTRDTTVVLWAILEGVGVGTMRFSLAVLACLCIGLVFLYIRFVAFGARYRHDVVVSLRWSGDGEGMTALESMLRRHGRRVQLADRRHTAQEGVSLAYRIQLRDPSRAEDMLMDVRTALGVEDVSMYQQEDESEI